MGQHDFQSAEAALGGRSQEPAPNREGTFQRMRKLALLLLCALACAPAAAKDTGLIFVSNERISNIVVIDPATYKIVKDIKTARRPRDLHFSADHSRLYVACGDDD